MAKRFMATRQRSEGAALMSNEAVSELVSTIIPVFNRSGMIRSAVQSVLDQTYRPIEIILVDDGSTDDTWSELSELAKRHPDEIRIAQRENGGPGLARETGRQMARGEYIQYFDSDDLLLPRKFEVQVAALKANPDCDIAYCRSSLIDQDGELLREPSKLTGRKMDALFPALLADRWWHTHTPLYRKSLCDQIGEWPAKRPEDWDYDARAGALGARLVFCDELLSCQRQHEQHSVTKWSFENYLPQEAWFLPRLYQCAVQAGVSTDSSEMHHFSRWAFSLSRRMAARGCTAEAIELFEVAKEANTGCSLKMGLYRFGSFILGRERAAKFAEYMSK